MTGAAGLVKKFLESYGFRSVGTVLVLYTIGCTKIVQAISYNIQ